MKASKKRARITLVLFFDTKWGQSRRHEVSKTQYAHLPMALFEPWPCAFDLVKRTLRDVFDVGRWIGLQFSDPICGLYSKLAIWFPAQANAHLTIRSEWVRFLPKITFTAFHSVQAAKGGFFIRKRLARAIGTIFPQPQAFTQTDFNMRSSKPNPWGQAPYTPNRYFASMQWYLHQCKHPAHKAIFHRPTAYAAGVPERGFFRCRRKRMARLGETCVNAHLLFLTNGCRLGGWELDGYALQ